MKTRDRSWKRSTESRPEAVLTVYNATPRYTATRPAGFVVRPPKPRSCSSRLRFPGSCAIRFSFHQRSQIPNLWKPVLGKNSPLQLPQLLKRDRTQPIFCCLTDVIPGQHTRTIVHFDEFRAASGSRSTIKCTGSARMPTAELPPVSLTCTNRPSQPSGTSKNRLLNFPMSCLEPGGFPTGIERLLPDNPPCQWCVVLCHRWSTWPSPWRTCDEDFSLGVNLQ